jgi:hypothetical protein
MTPEESTRSSKERNRLIDREVRAGRDTEDDQEPVDNLNHAHSDHAVKARRSVPGTRSNVEGSPLGGGGATHSPAEG